MGKYVVFQGKLMKLKGCLIFNFCVYGYVLYSIGDRPGKTGSESNRKTGSESNCF